VTLENTLFDPDIPTIDGVVVPLPPAPTVIVYDVPTVIDVEFANRPPAPPPPPPEKLPPPPPATTK
jgi:hypothetical protein